jgi:hypothetical protein
VVLLIGATASCTAAATATTRNAASPGTPAPVDSTATSPSLDASPRSSASPGISASPTRIASPSPARTQGPLPTAFPPVSALPSGNWTGIHWTKVKGQAIVWSQVPENDYDDATGVEHDYSPWKVFGWSRGYVAFTDATTIEDSGDFVQVMSTENSTDGVHWQAGGQFTLSGGPDEDTPDWDSEGVGALVEGPTGLVAVYTGEHDCGWGTYAYPLGTSTDGIHWQAAYVDLDSQTIEAGAAGYIATGKKSLFTSADGKSWKPVDLTNSAFTGLVGLEDGASFAGGFVISGEANLPEEGCGSDMTFETPSLWWSPDGKTWTRDKVPNVAGPSGLMFVWRVSEHVVMAEELGDDGIVRQWMSSDGRTWKTMPISKMDMRPDMNTPVQTVGDRSLLVADIEDSGPIYTLRDDLTVVQLVQTGDLPAYPDSEDDIATEHYPAFGPAGLIVAGGDGNTYIGVPVAG